MLKSKINFKFRIFQNQLNRYNQDKGGPRKARLNLLVMELFPPLGGASKT